jgi:hypothetical protein
MASRPDIKRNEFADQSKDILLGLENTLCVSEEEIPLEELKKFQLKERKILFIYQNPSEPA